ncbi:MULTISPECIES: hypothetical protein [unclassified Glutamicibacter]|uniref:hypothetical protein n=1 Tax=unclassified Glutamicibacter TaxID=2627139 RepID=UPI00381650AF
MSEELDLDELRATYDHPADKSVIELIDRLEQAEQAVARVREAMGKPWGSAITAKHIVRRALDGEQNV